MPRLRRRDRRARTPTVLQMEAVECGAASLAMVLGHYGRWVPLEDLRVACGVTRDGSKASNVLKAARRHGLTAKGFRKEPEKLLDLPIPSIIHWNFNHYLVFEGIARGRAFLNDPISGPRQVSLAELAESFTGVVLAFEPSPEFEKGSKHPSMLRELWSHVRRSRVALAYVGLASLLLIVPGVAIPACIRIFVDDVLVGGLTSWLVPLSIGMVVTAVLRGLLTHLQQKYLLRLETKLAVTLAGRCLHRMLDLPMAFFNQRHAGDLANRLGGADRVAQLVSGQLATNLFNLGSLLFFGLVMLGHDRVLGLLGAGLGSLNFVALRAAARKREDLSRTLLNEQGNLAAATVGAIRTIETLKAGGLENDAFARWAGYQARTLCSVQGLGLYSALLGVVPPLLAGLSTVALLGVGGWRVMEGAISIGALVALQSLQASFSEPLQRLVELGGSFQTIKGDLARLADIHRQAPDLERRAEGTEPATLNGAVELSKVSFGYSPLEPPLIADFSLALKPGMRVALVGASGSGKSTIARLMCGLLKPWSGEIRIDGRPLQSISAETFAGSVAYVDQEIFLFEGSVRSNLTLWDATVPESAITRALKDAEIHCEVAARPGRLDSVVSEGGLNFSGGQRQRLEIARALVDDPSLLVLDEATASLDPVTEKAIDDNIRRRGCSCVIIAHRLSTIRDADEIIVLRRGRVVERGTHRQLMANGGEYAELIAKG